MSSDATELQNKSNIRLVLFLVDDKPTSVIHYPHTCTIETAHETCINTFLRAKQGKDTFFISKFSPDFPPFFRNSPNFPILQSAGYYLVSEFSLPLRASSDIDLEYVCAEIITGHYSSILADRSSSENQVTCIKEKTKQEVKSEKGNGSEKGDESEQGEETNAVASGLIFTQNESTFE